MSTVNFRMVRLAREMQGISQTELAGDSGIPQPILSRIEGNLRAATEMEIDVIAHALGFPREFFCEPETPAAAPLFRKRAIRSASTMRTIQARINTAVLAARRILAAGVEVDTPFSFPEPGDIPRDSPVDASRTVRRAWRMAAGRVDNLTDVIESAGGIVLHVDFGSDHASAALVSGLGDPRLWFVVNTRETAGDRVRLSLAHELGHAVMHRYLPVHDELALEREAYEFAVALMLPPEDFNHRVEPEMTLHRARDLKRSYWVSVQAIIRAARDRRLITPARYLSLYKQISARGWRREEPEATPVETPAVWPAALEIHRVRHRYTDNDLAQIARLTPPVLHSLFPKEFELRFRLVPGGARPVPVPPSAGSRRISSA